MINEKIDKLKQKLIGKYKSNPFLFAIEICKFTDLEHEHKNWIKKLIFKDWYRLLILKPRETLKSSIYSVFFPIYYLTFINPDGRIAIINAGYDNSCLFLQQIKYIFESEEYINLFGNKKGLVWQIDTINLNTRQTKKRGYSIQAFGYGQNITSRHFDIIIIDDLCNEQDAESETYRKKKIKWFQYSLNLLAKLRKHIIKEYQEIGGKVLIVGTRWHTEDLYHYIIDDLNKQLKILDEKYLYNIEIETPYLENGKLRYPRLLSNEVIEHRRLEMGNIVFASQIMNNPIPDGTILFPLNRLKLFNYNKLKEKFRNEKQDIKFHGNRSFNIIVHYDPAKTGNKKSDFQCIIIGLIDHKNYLYIIDCFIKRCDIEIAINKILEYANFYTIDRMSIETSFFQSELKKSIEKTLKEKGIYIPIVNYEPYKNKQFRIQLLDLPITKGIILFRDDYNDCYKELINQIINFPIISNDDGPDSLEALYNLACKINKRKNIEFG